MPLRNAVFHGQGSAFLYNKITPIKTYVTKIIHLHIYIHWNTVKPTVFSSRTHDITQQIRFPNACYSRHKVLACKRKCGLFSYTSCIFTVGHLSCSVHLFTLLSTVLHHQTDTGKSSIKLTCLLVIDTAMQTRTHTRTQAHKHLSAFISSLHRLHLSSAVIQCSSVFLELFFSICVSLYKLHF